MFMRRHGQAHAMHRLTSYSMKMRGLHNDSAPRPRHVELPLARLRIVCRKIERKLTEEYRRRGIHGEIAGNVKRLFQEIDADGSDRVTFSELDEAIRERLRLDETAVTREDVLGLWTHIDSDKSGALTCDEFQQALYAIHVDAWPDLLAEDKEDALQRALGALNAAAEKWHQAGGNWFKIFKRVDADDSGQMHFEEFDHLCRAIYPGLNIDRKHLSDAGLKGLWRALDADRSGSVSVQEFMVFMRRHGMHHETLAYNVHKTHQHALDAEEAENTLDIKRGTGFRKLELLKAGARNVPSERGPDVSEWDFIALVRGPFGLTEDAFDDDDAAECWNAIDHRGAGFVPNKILMDWCRNPAPIRQGVHTFAE